MLDIKSISIEKGGKILANHISMSAKSGKFLSIVGPNGCGKTTLLHITARLLRADHGAIFVGGYDTVSLSQRELSAKLSFMPQKSRAAELSVFELTLLGRKPIFGLYPKADDYAKCEEVLLSLGLEAFAHRSCTTLSGGELQKALLAKALVGEPSVVLLDEPTNHLDAKNRVEMLSAFKKVAIERNIAVVAVLHDINDALRFCDEIALLNNGRLLHIGTPESITQSHLNDLYGIDAVVYENNGLRYAVFSIT